MRAHCRDFGLALARECVNGWHGLPISREKETMFASEAEAVADQTSLLLLLARQSV